MSAAASTQDQSPSPAPSAPTPTQADGKDKAPVQVMTLEQFEVTEHMPKVLELCTNLGILHADMADHAIAIIWKDHFAFLASMHGPLHVTPPGVTIDVMRKAVFIKCCKLENDPIVKPDTTPHILVAVMYGDLDGPPTSLMRCPLVVKTHPRPSV
jgi:hypothetical protein